MANFWSSAIGRPVDEGAQRVLCQHRKQGRSATPVAISQSPEAKTAKNRCHLDLEADDRPAEIQRLVELGATHIADKDEWDFQWSVMNDPEGNEFCISAPH